MKARKRRSTKVEDVVVGLVLCGATLAASCIACVLWALFIAWRRSIAV